MLNEWKKGVEGQWSNVQEEWKSERERLARAKEEWETKVMGAVESGVGKIEGGLATIAMFQREERTKLINNQEHKHGLATPPTSSPRSLSADSTRSRQRRKRSTSGGPSRGRSRSHTGDTTGSDDHLTDASTSTAVSTTSESAPDSISVGKKLGGLFGLKSRAYSPTMPDDVDDEAAAMIREKLRAAAESLATPEPSLHLSSSVGSVDDENSKFGLRRLGDGHIPMTASTAMGVLVLSVAAAAVIWRVKE